jgi:hypothetical protein
VKDGVRECKGRRTEEKIEEIGRRDRINRGDREDRGDSGYRREQERGREKRGK